MPIRSTRTIQNRFRLKIPRFDIRMQFLFLLTTHFSPIVAKNQSHYEWAFAAALARSNLFELAGKSPFQKGNPLIHNGCYDCDHRETYHYQEKGNEITDETRSM